MGSFWEARLQAMGERSVPAACVVLVRGWSGGGGGNNKRVGCGGVGERGRERKNAETSRHICAKGEPKMYRERAFFIPLCSVPGLLHPPTPRPQHWEHLAPKSNLPLPFRCPPPHLPLCLSVADGHCV